MAKMTAAERLADQQAWDAECLRRSSETRAALAEYAARKQAERDERQSRIRAYQATLAGPFSVPRGIDPRADALDDAMGRS